MTPNLGVTSPGTPVGLTPKTFNQYYCASKNPAFWPLYAGRPDYADASMTTERMDRWANLPSLSISQSWALVGQLIAQGFIVDEEIDAEGCDPYTTMFMRELYGNTWEPAGLGATQVTDINQPGAVVTAGEYSGPVPPGQIKVSLLLSDYPAYVPPASGVGSVPFPPYPNPVGIQIINYGAPGNIGNIFRCAVANDGYALGATWTGTSSGGVSGTFTKGSLEMGIMIIWTLTAALGPVAAPVSQGTAG